MNQPNETLLTFPCTFPLKVVGKANEDFEVKALSIIKKHIHNLSEDAIQQRLSKDGTYLAITVTFQAESQAQLDALYEELTKEKSVIMAL